MVKLQKKRFFISCQEAGTEDEAASMIVKGFLSMDIAGLPPELAAETKKMIDLSIQGM